MTHSPNRLQHEKSPYLQQHAFNPVDWYPWGVEAFTRAREESKPVFLSVGYSTCHWCHVMERESFENEIVAALLNEHFVSIKVDREERPDVDRIYMTALQAMGQQGGWPMSMFLVPDGRPFYGGTYYPPETRYGRAGFADILRRIHQIWTQEREAVLDSAGRITQFLEDVSRGGERGPVPAATALDQGYRQFASTFDPKAGGFGGAPKFPRPSVFEFLLRYHARTGDEHSLEMVERTVASILRGGMTDQLGGGFHRYAVDGEWRVPHFEKMLYDQAQLSLTLADLYQLTRKSLYATHLRRSLEYVASDLSAPEGGFYSAEDADSPRPEEPGEQGEGAFYLWSAEEIGRVLGDDAEVFCFLFGVEERGNVAVDPQQEFTGKNILYQAHTPEEAAERYGRPVEEIRSVVESSRRRLLNVRRGRPRPHLDDKVLASWNGLMIAAFARASWVLEDTHLWERARQAAEFVLGTLVDEETWTVRRRYRDGDARYAGQLDDYIALARGMLVLFETSGEVRWLSASANLTNRALELFVNPSGGALFDSPGSDATVLLRMREQYDGAEPSGNSLAAMHFLRLAQLTGDVRWREFAGGILQGCAQQVERHPVALPYMLAALDLYLFPGPQLVVTGRPNTPLTSELLSVIRTRYVPSGTVLLIDEESDTSELTRLVPWVAEHASRARTIQAYVCRDFRCELPTANPDVLAGLLTSPAQ